MTTSPERSSSLKSTAWNLEVVVHRAWHALRARRRRCLKKRMISVFQRSPQEQSRLTGRSHEELLDLPRLALIERCMDLCPGELEALLRGLAREVPPQLAT